MGFEGLGFSLDNVVVFLASSSRITFVFAAWGREERDQARSAVLSEHQAWALTGGFKPDILVTFSAPLAPHLPR